MTQFSIRAARLLTGISFCLILQTASAQTDMDAIMLPRNYFCSGAMFSQSSWNEYWEGDFKRSNKNLGTVTTQMYGIMGNYGVSDKLNVLFSLPYVKTTASAGTLKGMHGVQDLSLTAKWMPVERVAGKGKFSLIALGGISFPASNYVADFLPLSIGLHTRNAWMRAMADFQLGHFFATLSGSYTRRSNLMIDRTAYYTTEMHYTNEVNMPDMAGFNIRSGIRSKKWIAEAVVDNFRTLGGFDIRKNDMPFPSNRMNGTRAGVNLKYSFRSIDGLELTGGGNYLFTGRNTGQATTINAGVFYFLDLAKKNKTTTNK